MFDQLHKIISLLDNLIAVVVNNNCLSSICLSPSNFSRVMDCVTRPRYTPSNAIDHFWTIHMVGGLLKTPPWTECTTPTSNLSDVIIPFSTVTPGFKPTQVPSQV